MTDTKPQDGRLALDPRRLKAHRKRLGLSQEALAQHCFDRRLCVSIASIKRAESGRPVLYRTARHLASIYDVSPESLAAVTPAGSEPTPPPTEVAADDEPRSVIRLVAMLSANETSGIADLVEHFGGSLLASADASSASGIEAIFGMPRAYRSDALRCLRCAIALGERPGVARVICFSQQWPLPAEAPSPEPAAEDVEPGAIWVERGLAVQLSEHFAFAESPRPLLRYRRPLASPAGVRGELVGRHVEISQLKSILETTWTYQSGHIIYVRGMAGIGKTRLSGEFAEMVRQQEADLHGASVLDFGARTDDGPLAQLLRSLLQLPDAGAPVERQLQARLQALGRPDDDAMLLRPLIGLPQPPEHRALFAAMTHATRTERLITALRELILRQAIERPQVFIVEDLHWADDTLFPILSGLLKDALEAPVIWLLTSRLEQDPLETRFRPHLADLPLTLIDLAPLRAAEAEALASRFGAIEPAYARRCVAKAQGNPLFLTQLLLFHPGKTLPASLTNLVQTKLDQLTSLDRRALRLAAAIGQRFSLQALRELLGQEDYRPERAQFQNLVRPLDADDYLFVHDLILQGIYESIPKAQRHRLHLRLADHFADRDLVLRAQHLHKARSLDAPAAFVEAIEGQLRRHHHTSALALLQLCQAIDYARRDDYRLHLLHAQACLATGLIQEAHTHYQTSRRLARDDLECIDACLGLARTLNMLDELDAEEGVLDEIMPRATARRAHGALAEIHYLKGNVYFPRGDFARSRDYHRQALEHARLSGDKRTEIQALSGLGDADYAEGHMLSTRRVFEHCVALCREHDHSDLEASNLFMLGTARIYTNDTDEALSDSLAAAELGRRVGNRRAEVVARLTAGWILLSRAQTEAAEEQVATALDVARAMGSSRFEAFLLESQARLRLIGGQADEARNAIRIAWHLVQRHQLQRFIGPWVLGTLALLEQSREEQQAALRQGRELLEQGCVGHNGYRFLISAAEVELLQHRPGQARRYAQRLEAFTAAEPCAWARHHVALIEAHGDWLEQPSEATLDRARRCWQAGADQGLVLTMPRLALAHYRPAR